MTDPHTAAAVATAAVTFLAPYFAEAGKGGAKKIGEAAGTKVVALWGRLRDRLTSAGGGKKVEKFEAAPEDPQRQTILAGELEELFEADPTWRDQIAQQLRDAGVAITVGEQRLTQVGNDNSGVQAVGSNQISIHGRGQAT